LRGAPKLRLREGERTLHEGDVVALPRGPEGGGAISNPGDTIARVLMLSSNADPDVAEYPEAGGRHHHRRQDMGVLPPGRYGGERVVTFAYAWCRNLK
jgi:uncharacterized cupin superfamily protein